MLKFVITLEDHLTYHHHASNHNLHPKESSDIHEHHWLMQRAVVVEYLNYELFEVWLPYVSAIELRTSSARLTRIDLPHFLVRLSSFVMTLFMTNFRLL